ncbi:DEAD/DEAH box helicase [Pontibacillus marinus]|uniref:ATP-dependent RNA helicase DbpA n=1 Tax=Pontibacillus marinus BH030004 = DSM 16465 TaxID=1385511 RepID=A0A0A5HYM5_9BACI|nr:DEAD/DEAH box helicase [Pontibacillus marinus]KGX88717.1 RNA helicase [Pontibacillus marinus BH030004 = DSM 16465]
MNVDFKNYGLSEDLLKALSGLAYDTPTEVQDQVIPQALMNKDLVVKSQTGSGKTASFGIPICEKVLWEENKPQALILTPTRELAAQIKEDITNIGRFKRIKATAVYGKQPFQRQKLELKQKSHVVVGTPGRVLDHLEKGTLSTQKLDYLVIDEADEMLNMGFIDQVEAIIQKLPKDRATYLFSATLPEDIEALSRNYMRQPLHIEIEATRMTTDNIDHSYIEVLEEDKLSLLKDITTVENPDRCIIFCRTQEHVNQLMDELDRLHYPVDKLHGGMVQEDRFEVMDDFKEGKFRYLVATDVAARGIDVENITHVINYDMPLEKESYVHRTGRTARAGKSGIAISFVTPSEGEVLENIQDYIGFSIPKVTPPSNEAIAKASDDFKKKLDQKPAIEKDRKAHLNKDIMKLYFNGGKKKKIRAVDFVGTISNIEGVSADDIGIITIQENLSYVEILNGKGPRVLQAMKNTTVKGKKLKVHEARK